MFSLPPGVSHALHHSVITPSHQPSCCGETSAGLSTSPLTARNVRYLAIQVTAGRLPTNFTVAAWGVKYEYEATDSAFVSDNDTLNTVHELARWTLDGGVVDTYTDSNTRERRPCVNALPR